MIQGEMILLLTSIFMALTLLAIVFLVALGILRKNNNMMDDDLTKSSYNVRTMCNKVISSFASMFFLYTPTLLSVIFLIIFDRPKKGYTNEG